MNSINNKVRFSLTWKVAAIFSLLFAAIFFLTLVGITDRVAQKADEQVMVDLIQVLEGTARAVDVDILMELAQEGKANAQGFSDDSRYLALMNKLNEIHAIEPDAWPYLYIPAEKEGYIYFVVDLYAIYDTSASSGFMELYKSNSGYILLGLEEQTFRAVDSYAVASLRALADRFQNEQGDSRFSSWLQVLADWLSDKKPFAPREFGTYGDQFGRWASGYMPLENSDGERVAGIGVDFRADTINQIRSEVGSTVKLSFTVSYLVMLPLVILISIKLTKPIVELTEIATSIGQNQKQVDLPDLVEKRFTDEINILEQVLFNTYRKLQNANAHLQGLSHQLITDREQYRKELARDLHDNVLSYLSVLSSNQPAELQPEAMQENYKQVINRLRATIFSLRSPMMEYGLTMAIEDMVDHFQSQASHEDIAVHLELPASEARFENPIETHSFRIIQQAFENGVEHAKASEIKISGIITEKLIEIKIEDNGTGLIERIDGEIDLDRYEAKQKFGMVGMIERASLIGARLEIDLRPEGGTMVTLRWQP
jgi:signal transduction histidine kinase